MTNNLCISFFNFPVTRLGTSRANAQLTIHSPRLRKSHILGMVENGYMCQVITTFYLHGHIHPHGTLLVRFFIALSRSINRFARNAFFPWHAQKQSTIIKFANGNISYGSPLPFEVKKKFSLLLPHFPDLCFLKYRVAISIQQIIHCLPGNLSAF